LTPSARNILPDDGPSFPCNPDRVISFERFVIHNDDICGSMAASTHLPLRFRYPPARAPERHDAVSDKKQLFGLIRPASLFPSIDSSATTSTGQQLRIDLVYLNSCEFITDFLLSL